MHGSNCGEKEGRTNSSSSLGAYAREYRRKDHRAIEERVIDLEQVESEMRRSLARYLPNADDTYYASQRSRQISYVPGVVHSSRGLR